jgi:hypothetical protein
VKDDSHIVDVVIGEIEIIFQGATGFDGGDSWSDFRDEYGVREVF